MKRFPDIRVARTVENTLHLVALMLWIAHFLALYLRPLPRPRGDTRGAGHPRPDVAGDPGHLRCAAGRRARAVADGAHLPRGGHVLRPAYGKGVGGLTVALGSATIAAAAVALVDPTSPIAAVGVFALIAFHLAVGWRTYRAGRVLRLASQKSAWAG